MTDSTGTLTLTDFLLDRLAELELSAQVALATAPSDPVEGITPAGAVWFTPEQVLADVAAKRAIVVEYEDLMSDERNLNDAGLGGVISGFEVAMQHLATTHASHPDYRPEWKP